jgi:hypothetical protein
MAFNKQRLDNFIVASCVVGKPLLGEIELWQKNAAVDALGYPKWP